MKLGVWLDREGLTAAAFAARIDRTGESVRRYVAGVRIPDRDTMPLIIEHTGGEVMPNDFFEASDPALDGESGIADHGSIDVGESVPSIGQSERAPQQAGSRS